MVYSDRDQQLLAASHLAEPYLCEEILSLLLPRKHQMSEMDCKVERAAAKAAPKPPPAVRCCYCGSATKGKTDLQPERLMRKHCVANSPPRGFSLVRISHIDTATHSLISCMRYRCCLPSKVAPCSPRPYQYAACCRCRLRPALY